jgi:hypothetical protein
VFQIQVASWKAHSACAQYILAPSFLPLAVDFEGYVSG